MHNTNCKDYCYSLTIIADTVLAGAPLSTVHSPVVVKTRANVRSSAVSIVSITTRSMEILWSSIIIIHVVSCYLMSHIIKFLHSLGTFRSSTVVSSPERLTLAHVRSRNKFNKHKFRLAILSGPLALRGKKMVTPSRINGKNWGVKILNSHETSNLQRILLNNFCINFRQIYISTYSTHSPFLH